MREKILYKKIQVGIALLIVSLSLIAYGNGQNDDKGTIRMSEGKEETTQSEESLKLAKAELAEFVQSDGPDTIVIEDFTYYKIGKMYEPGEYVLVPSEGDLVSYSIIMDDEAYTPLLSDNTKGYTVFNTLEGQYISISGGEIYPIDKAPKIKKTADGAYPEGLYKAGVQIPAGEYVGRGDYPSLTTYAGLSDNDLPIGYCSNTRSAIITVDEGEYIKATWGDIYPLESTADLRPIDGIYKEGTYKVGFHMPAGTYQLKATTGRAYVDIYNDGYMLGRGDEFVVADPETYFTVRNGQFVMIVGGEAATQYEFVN